jgi:class 3 adenylate cyclase
MAEKLVYAPPTFASPAACEQVGAPRAALDALRAHFELTVFTWPCIKGGPEVEPTWQGAADALGAALSPGSHLVATGGGALVALMTVSKWPALVRSFIVDEIGVPDATLRALGQSSLAEASAASYETGHHVHQLTRGLNEPGAAQIRADLDIKLYQQLTASIESMNLLDLQPRVAVPCLFLSPTEGVFAEGEALDIFTRFAPNTTTRRMERWLSANVEDPDVGQEFNGYIIEFINSLDAQRRFLTLLFTDIVDSTVRALELGDRRWAELLSAHHSLVRETLDLYGGREIDNAGDGFLVSFESPTRALRCALEVRDEMAKLGLEVRAGPHAGECEMVGEKPGGATVHAAARIASAAQPGEVLTSSRVADLASGDDLILGEPREAFLKGLPGEWRLFPVQRAGSDGR